MLTGIVKEFAPDYRTVVNSRS